jgi:hypothetical protein
MEREAEIVWRATIGAALAQRGRSLQTTAVAIGAAAIGLGIALATLRPERHGLVILSTCVAEFGLVAFGLYLGQRVALDADLFAALARNPDPAGFDAAMVDFDLIKPSAAGRSMRERTDGLKRLLLKQVGAIVVQMALVVILLFGGLG